MVALFTVVGMTVRGNLSGWLTSPIDVWNSSDGP